MEPIDPPKALGRVQLQGPRGEREYTGKVWVTIGTYSDEFGERAPERTVHVGVVGDLGGSVVTTLSLDFESESELGTFLDAIRSAADGERLAAADEAERDRQERLDELGEPLACTLCEKKFLEDEDIAWIDDTTFEESDGPEAVPLHVECLPAYEKRVIDLFRGLGQLPRAVSESPELPLRCPHGMEKINCAYCNPKRYLPPIKLR